MRFKYTNVSIDQIAKDMEEMPSALVVAVYDEAIASLRAALDAIERLDIEARCDATVQTAEVLSVLRLALDHQGGGAIAANLDRLYAFVIAQLPLLNSRNDAEIAAGLIAVLEPLRAGWAELDDRIRAELDYAENLLAAHAVAVDADRELRAAQVG
jgi:flagellar protein FliS